MSLIDTCTGDLMDPDFELSSTELSKKMNHLSNVIRKWRDEYLIQLRNLHRHSARNAASTLVNVGDMLVVHDEDLSRGLWKLARVESLVTETDGVVRGATLKRSEVQP